MIQLGNTEQMKLKGITIGDICFFSFLPPGESAGHSDSQSVKRTSGQVTSSAPCSLKTTISASLASLVMPMMRPW